MQHGAGRAGEGPQDRHDGHDKEALPQPDLRRLGSSLKRPGRSVALTGLFVLASFYTLYFASSSACTSPSRWAPAWCW